MDELVFIRIYTIFHFAGQIGFHFKSIVLRLSNRNGSHIVDFRCIQNALNITHYRPEAVLHDESKLIFDYRTNAMVVRNITSILIIIIKHHINAKHVK